MGGDNWFVRLHQVSEVIPIPAVVPVPLTQPWFCGVANVRGNLYSMVDFARFLGRNESPATAGAQGRLVVFGARAGELRTSIVVQRVVGLRNVTELAPAAPVPGALAWYGQRWMDANGSAWQEIDLARLAQDPAFLHVGA